MQNLFLKVKDHSVSQEEFSLILNSAGDMLITFPKPELSQLSKYYESDDYISHTDSKRSIFEYAYHVVKQYALKKKLSLIQQLYPKKENLLDIGAGTGDFLKVANADQWKVFGAEPSDRAREIAKSKGISLAKDTSTFPTGKFDVITMWHVLEHVFDLDQQIMEIDRLLSQNGTIVIAVPNFRSFDAKHYAEFWAAYDVPRHLWHFSSDAIRRIFAARGFELTQTLPMKFDAYYVSLLSEKYRTGKMNYLNAINIGWKSNRQAKRSSEYSSHIYILKRMNSGKI